jgi:hypothetical protein
MAAKKLGNMVAVTGTYTDRGGNEKKRYTRVGVLFEGEDGSHYGIFDSCPIGWDGRFSVYPDKDKEQGQSAPESAPTQSGGGFQPDTDIPF